MDIAQLLYYAAAAVATYYALQFSSILLPTGGKPISVVVSELGRAAAAGERNLTY